MSSIIDKTKIKKKANGVKQRTLNNSVELTVPLEDKIMQFLFKNEIIEQKPNGEIWAVCVPRLRHLSEVDIVNRYNAQIRGICNYYCLAANYDKLNYFRYLMEYSCLKTLASKSNSTTRKIIKKYRHNGKWAIPEDILYNKCCEVLQLDEFDTEIFHSEIESIIVPEPNVLTFIFKDGHNQTVHWLDHSRSESWTSEMRKRAAQNTREKR